MTRATNILNDTFTKEDQLRLSPEERNRIMRQIEREMQSKGEEEVRRLLRQERQKRDAVTPANQAEQKPDMYNMAAVALVFATIDSAFNPDTGTIDEVENDFEFCEGDPDVSESAAEIEASSKFGWGSPFPDPTLVRDPRPAFA